MTIIPCELNFGMYGDFTLNFSLEDAEKQQLDDFAHSCGKNITDVLIEFAVEYVITMRSYIETTNKQFNYDKLEFVDIGKIKKMSGNEIRKKMSMKEEVITKNKSRIII